MVIVVAFFGVSLYVLLASHPPLIYTLIFRQIKGAQVVYIWAKFYLFLISSSQGFKIQEFSE